MAEIAVEILEQADIQNAIARGYRIERIVDGRMYLSNKTRAEVFAEELGGKRKEVTLSEHLSEEAFADQCERQGLKKSRVGNIWYDPRSTNVPESDSHGCICCGDTAAFGICDACYDRLGGRLL